MNTTSNPAAVLAALEPRSTDTVERIARRWLRASVTTPTPARRVYFDAERVGLTVADVKAGLRRSGLRFEQVAGCWFIRPATTAERDEASRVAIARHWNR
jgi:hypothetical protein